MFIIIHKKRITSIAIFFILLFLVSITVHFTFNKILGSPNHVVNGVHRYFILIFVEEKKLYLFEDGQIIKKYPIASGRPEWPSPIGYWEIINKGDWGEGFGGRWLGLNVPWGKYGIHGTTTESSIGHSASHGCIRMFNKHVKELYSIVPIGTPVQIKNGPFGPFGTGFRELYPGDRGADVLAVQQKLKVLGYYQGWESGIYEDNLKRALHSFQKDHQLKIKDAITRVDYHSMGFSEFE